MVLTKYVSRSIYSATGQSQILADQNIARRELYIHNISSSDWWINLLGGTAGPGIPDCTLLKPRDTMSIDAINAVTGRSALGAALTVLER